MEYGDKLKELNLTEDEINRFSNALKETKFREMLFDYAAELSDPENKKKYEEEIRLLEQDRGNDIIFIHPEPCRVLKTSLDGKQKCFINICTNEKVDKPQFVAEKGEAGASGKLWSLPHSLAPGRQGIDPKGKKFMIYDAVFHPDTLHLAKSNARFMKMVDGVALQGIQDGFKVKLDKNNVRVLTIKYKGTPQPAVIRKPIPGYSKKEPSAEPDPLAFPYPDKINPATTTKLNTPTEAPKSSAKVDNKPMNTEQIKPTKPNVLKEPTIPKYTLKYRSYIDLQDYRCSRDSAQSPRPKEIVITVNVPLLKSAHDADLEVKEKLLLLESKKPAYRLEVPLAYSVDENKGEAKFNKQKGQLTITLPVLPSNENFFSAKTFSETLVNEGDREGQDVRENEKETDKSDIEENRCDETDEAETTEDICESPKHISEVCSQAELSEDKDVSDVMEQTDSVEIDNSLPEYVTIFNPEENNNQTTVRSSSNGTENNKEMLAQGDTSLGDVLFHETQEDEPVLQKCEKVKKKKIVQFVEEVLVAPQEEAEEMDEDDLSTEQKFSDNERTRQTPPSALLWERNKDGQETVISNHSTSAGFTFINSMLYELD